MVRNCVWFEYSSIGETIVRNFREQKREENRYIVLAVCYGCIHFGIRLLTFQFSPKLLSTVKTFIIERRRPSLWGSSSHITKGRREFSNSHGYGDLTWLESSHPVLSISFYCTGVRVFRIFRHGLLDYLLWKIPPQHFRNILLPSSVAWFENLLQIPKFQS